MDPITTAIVGALANLGSSVVKDAYEALKSAIAHKFGVDSNLAKSVEDLQQKPKSSGRQATLSEEIVEAQADKDSEIFKLAQILSEKVDSPSTSQDSTVITQKAGDNAIQVGQTHGNVTIH